jgi:hypothetical protein
MIEVQPQTRNAVLGLVAIILAAGWAAYGLIGAGAAVLVRARPPQQ